MSIFRIKFAVACVFAMTLPQITLADSRTFVMGFTDYYYARSPEAVFNTWAIIREYGDLLVYHDEGVPWNEALSEAEYTDEFKRKLADRQIYAPDGHKVYVAVSPLNFLRNGLAAYPGGVDQADPPWPWNELEFDNPWVMAAYYNHCVKMIETYHPDYFAYAIEANLLWTSQVQRWPAFYRLLAFTYTALKQRYPELPLFSTIQVDAVNNSPEQLVIANQLLSLSDVVALSAYPYTQYADPLQLPIDYFSRIMDLAPQKPVAISETGWPAEDVLPPFFFYIPANQFSQSFYLSRVLGELKSKHAIFMNWFTAWDYDALWQSDLQYSKNAPLLRQWKDIGFINGDGNFRLFSWLTWNSYFSLPLLDLDKQ